MAKLENILSGFQFSSEPVRKHCLLIQLHAIAQSNASKSRAIKHTQTCQICSRGGIVSVFPAVVPLVLQNECNA